MKENWPEILNACIDDAHALKFVWGKCDCCLWAADVVLEMTGVDYASEIRGKYKSARGALKLQKKHSIESFLDSKLERVAFASRGDFILVKSTDNTDGLGVCVGSAVAVMDDEQGLVFLPCEAYDVAWSVPRG